jgi:hypothetical protein
MASGVDSRAFNAGQQFREQLGPFGDVLNQAQNGIGRTVQLLPPEKQEVIPGMIIGCTLGLGAGARLGTPWLLAVGGGAIGGMTTNIIPANPASDFVDGFFHD